jgi:hypothetical protein
MEELKIQLNASTLTPQPPGPADILSHHPSRLALLTYFLITRHLGGPLPTPLHKPELQLPAHTTATFIRGTHTLYDARQTKHRPGRGLHVLSQDPPHGIRGKA